MATYYIIGLMATFQQRFYLVSGSHAANRLIQWQVLMATLIRCALTFSVSSCTHNHTHPHMCSRTHAHAVSRQRERGFTAAAPIPSAFAPDGV
eukprot:4168636-Pleurochrysis_carterae.AAC.2